MRMFETCCQYTVALVFLLQAARLLKGPLQEPASDPLSVEKANHWARMAYTDPNRSRSCCAS